MHTVTPVKEKKKVSSSSKQNRSNIVETLKRNPTIELKKGEIIQLLKRFEAELQAKDIAITVLKSEKVRLLLSNIRLNGLNRQTDPYIALFRDSQYVQEDRPSKEIEMKNGYETRFLQLVAQQKKQVEILKSALEIAEKRCLALSRKLENEKKDTVQPQAFRNQLSVTEAENSQLRNNLNSAQLHSKELEQQLVQIMELFEHEHERHKNFVILFLNNRKLENEHHKEQIKQLSNRLTDDDRQSQVKFTEIKLENEHNQQVLTKRIEQLQNQIDLLIKEKKQQATSNMTDSSSTSKILSSSNELTSRGDIHSPTIIPTSSSSKTKSAVPSISTRTPQSLPMANPRSSVLAVAKRIVISAPPSTSGNNATRSSSNPSLKENLHQIAKLTTITDSTKRTNQISFSSEHKTDDIRALLKTIHAVGENRLNTQTTSVDSSLHSDSALFSFAESGNTDELFELLKLGCNPNSQKVDGNTCLHISAANGHIECIQHLLQFGANSYLENNLGVRSWDNLSQLNETIELECLHEFVNYDQNLPPIELIFNAVQRNHMNTYNYLLSLAHEQIKTDSSSLSRLLRTALRSSNTYFLQCLLPTITAEDLIELIDRNTYISSECLTILSSIGNEQAQSKSINLTVCISSSNREHRFSYAIGIISITTNTSWLEVERLCGKVFIDHITQIDSPFDYNNSSTGCSTNNIDTLTFGLTKWHYQDSPNGDSSMPYTVAQGQKTIIIHLKGMDINSTDSLAYNYFISSQNLKTFIRYIEQHTYVGVYGAAYLQKKSLFEDLIRYFERPTTCPKFRVIRFEFESVTCLDDCIDELVEQDFLRTNQWQETHLKQHYSTKVLLYFANVQNNGGSDIINLLLNSESISDLCHKFSYSREDDSNSTMTYYFPSIFHIFVTLSKRAWSTETEIYKRFKWISFKIESVPWDGLLKRYLWRRMIDINIRENRSNDQELMKTLQWVTNVWQRYNECLPKLSLQDAALGPALFFDCPMEREAIFEWLQTKWNTIIVPLVRELVMNKYITQSKSKSSAILASSVRANNLEIHASNEVNVYRTLYVLLQRAVSRDCPLKEQERDQYLLDFIGSRVEGGSGSSSMISSAPLSGINTPQPTDNYDFMSPQFE